MKLNCPREADLLTALRQQRWPDACEPELRAHVEHCAACSDLLLVAHAVQQAQRDGQPPAALPAPGILWWRAQLLRRNGAIERVHRPIVLAEKIAWAGICAVTIALALWQRHQLVDWFFSLASAAKPDPVFADRLWLFSTASGWTIALIVAAIGTLSLLGGVAVYLVAKED